MALGDHYLRVADYFQFPSSSGTIELECQKQEIAAAEPDKIYQCGAQSSSDGTLFDSSGAGSSVATPSFSEAGLWLRADRGGRIVRYRDRRTTVYDFTDSPW